MNSKSLIAFSFVLFNVLVRLSADDSFNTKPEKCKVRTTQLDSIIEQLGECSEKKWQPLEPKKSFVSKLLPTGFPKIKLLPNGTSVKNAISGAVNTSKAVLTNITNIFYVNLSDPVPNFLKKFIPKSLLKRPNILGRGRGQKVISELQLNERVCCLLYENICVRNKVYRMNCKMSREFNEEVQQNYDKLLESCAENGLYIEESFCAEQKTETYGSNSTCDEYLPCSQTQVFSVYVENSCQSISPQYLTLFFISIIISLFYLK